VIRLSNFYFHTVCAIVVANASRVTLRAGARQDSPFVAAEEVQQADGAVRRPCQRAAVGKSTGCRIDLRGRVSVFWMSPLPCSYDVDLSHPAEPPAAVGRKATPLTVDVWPAQV